MCLFVVVGVWLLCCLCNVFNLFCVLCAAFACDNVVCLFIGVRLLVLFGVVSVVLCSCWFGGCFVCCVCLPCVCVVVCCVRV